MPSRKIRIIQFGIGPIGAGIAKVIAQRPEFVFVGAVDVDPTKIGCDLGSLIDLKHDLGVVVSDNAKAVLSKRAAVVIHSTSSSFEKVLPELTAIVNSGHNVVSTCEELADPWWQNRKAADQLDRLARQKGVTVLGTGINPGFAMDTLPVALSAVCQSVDSVRVRRVVDASRRRMQLQKKIGTGLSPAGFRERAAGREIRHVGLTESAALIARGLGWQLDSIQETIEPAVAKQRVVTEYFTVEPGFVTGVKQSARGLAGGRELIKLELEMSVDAGQSSDELWIDGKPPIHAVVNGIQGDLSTAAVTANAVRRVIQAPPGLLTMLDLPVVSSTGRGK